MAPRQFLEPAQQLSRRAGNAFHEPVREQDVEHRVANRHGQRIAAEGAAVQPRGHAGSRLLRGQEGAEREATADALGQAHDIGRDAGPFIGE